MNKESFYTILCCPYCKNPVDENLICSECNYKYTLREEIYIMINPEVSGKEWKWDESLFSEEKQKILKEKYESYINEETKKAQEIWWKEIEKHIDSFEGLVLDIATGLGGMLEKLLESKKNFLPIASDVDPNVLNWTRKKMRRKYRKDFFCVATDAKYLAFKDEIFDYVTSCAGFNNIPETKYAFREVYRTLKQKGKLIFMHSFIEKDSKSFELACKFHVERAFVKEYLFEDLTKVGFKNIRIHIVSSAIWEKNPMDLLPVGGDKQYFTVIEAEK